LMFLLLPSKELFQCSHKKDLKIKKVELSSTFFYL
jgi:hypothetical protein